MDHETCSAQLPQLARGELADADRRALESHLADCPDCARELTAVRALMALPDAQMTADERRALHQAVLSPQPRRWARLAPALGAVGLLVVAAIGVTYFTGDGSDSLPSAVQMEADTNQTLEQGADDADTAGRSANRAAVQPHADQATTSDAAGGGTTSEGFAAGSLVVTKFSTADLGPHLLAYDDADVSLREALRRDFRTIPDAGSQLIECATVVQDLYSSPLRPAFASVYPADQLLVMGFVFRAGAEQRYAFWGWHLGDCTRPTPIYVTGALQ